MKSRTAVLTMTVISMLFMVAAAAFPAVDGRIDLSGAWKFQIDPKDLGLSEGWYKSEYDASSWQKINVPGDWEAQGVTQPNPQWTEDDLNQPYSGYAWYRRSVTIPADWKDKKLFFNLGRIDDKDWAYLNGVPIGQTTSTPGRWISSVFRSYEIPSSVVKFGQPNVIAVRVLDMRGLGGIVEGRVSITAGEPEAYEEELAGASDEVRVVGDLVVGKTQTVGDAIAVAGDVIVWGRVTGDAVAVAGSVRVQGGGRVDGDAVSIGGEVVKEGDAYVGGETIGLGGWTWSAKRFVPSFTKNWFFSALVGRLVDFWNALLFAALAVVIVALFRVRMETVAGVAFERAGLSAVYGIVAWLLIIPVAVLLLVTCIGIPLIAVEILLVVAAWIAGSVAVSLALGRRIGEALDLPIASAALATFIGAVVLGVIGLVPLAGDLVVFALSLIGFGAALLTGFGTDPMWFPNRSRRK